MPKYKSFIPYTYLIGWTKHNLYYYGSEYGALTKIAHPSNLWNTYFTSCKKINDYRKTLGEPDLISIRKTFYFQVDCINWEAKVLRRLKVLNKSNWINSNVNGKFVIDAYTEKVRRLKIKKSWTEARKRQASQKSFGELNHYFGKRHSAETREKLSLNHHDVTGERNPMFGRTHTSITKRKIGESNRGRARTAACRQKMSQNRRGRNRGRNASQFIGYYVTPFGQFESSLLAQEHIKISRQLVSRLCRSENTKPLTHRQCVFYNQFELFKSLDLVAGKTPNDLGFGFIPT
jgi:hypothetical protein